jgi:hypothetical protein
MAKNLQKKTNYSLNGYSAANSFLLSYLTLIIIILGFFIYLTSAEELKTKTAKKTWQQIKLAAGLSNQTNTDLNSFSSSIDASLKPLLAQSTTNKIQFNIDTKDIFELNNDQIKPQAVSLLNKISALAIEHQARINSHLQFNLQPETTPQHFKEVELSFNRSHSLLRFFIEELKTSTLVNSKINGISKGKLDNNIDFLELSLEI